MKVAVECTSPLLQKSLEIFLKPYLSSIKQCDVVLRDYKVRDDKYCSLYVASSDDADIKKPFSEAELKRVLHQALQHDEQRTRKDAGLAEAVTTRSSNDMRHAYKQLEAHIEALTQEYQNNILKAVKAFYDTKNL